MATIALKVLLVVTSHSQLGNTGKLTGYYLPEVAHPYQALASQGFQVDIASPKGGKAPLDANSIHADDKVSVEFYENKITRSQLENTLKLSEVNPQNYAAVVYAGGHGTMYDFRGDTDIEIINRTIYEKGGVVAAVCHGPAALLTTKLSNGEYLIAGKNVAGFSDAEEEAAGLTQVMPFLLETEMIKIGAKYSKAGLWEKHVVVDGRLVTGQNPASAEEVGRKVAEVLSK
jgi:putative intracellular protease/amidase